MDQSRLIWIGIAVVFVVFAMLLSTRKKRQFAHECAHSHGRDVFKLDDEVLAVKKVTPNPPVKPVEPAVEIPVKRQASDLVVYHLIAPHNKAYVGYELLQALHSAGLRYGEMAIFHRYEHEQGLGKILFSVAKANEPGTFDMENMGGTSCLGLTFFSQFCDDDLNDLREELLEQTLIELAEDLGGVIVDSHRQPVQFN